MAFLEVNIFYFQGRGLRVKAFKPIITEDDLKLSGYINRKIQLSYHERLNQDDLHELKVQLDPIILDDFGFFSYNLEYVTSSYILGITSLGPTISANLGRITAPHI